VLWQPSTGRSHSAESLACVAFPAPAANGLVPEGIRLSVS
jgi:hypothetical protein